MKVKTGKGHYNFIIDSSELELHAKHMERIASDDPGVIVYIKCRATPGTGDNLAKGAQLPRSAGKNTTILRTHLKRGRAPVFLSDSEYGTTLRMLRNGINDHNAGRSGGMVRSGAKIGETFVGAIKSHIDSGRSKRGAMKPLSRESRRYLNKKGEWRSSQSYNTFKEKNFPGKPILKLTGQLYDSLYSTVVKKSTTPGIMR